MPLQPNISRPRYVRAYLPPKPVGPRVEVLLAKRWGTTEGTAHQRMLLLAQQAGDVIACMVDAQQFGRAVQWMAPIYAAIEVPQPRPYGPELVHAAQEADLAEDIAESRGRCDPSDVNLIAWERALSEQEFRCRDLRLAIYRHRMIRGAE